MNISSSIMLQDTCKVEETLQFETFQLQAQYAITIQLTDTLDVQFLVFGEFRSPERQNLPEYPGQTATTFKYSLIDQNYTTLIESLKRDLEAFRLFFETTATLTSKALSVFDLFNTEFVRMRVRQMVSQFSVSSQVYTTEHSSKAHILRGPPGVSRV